MPDGNSIIPLDLSEGRVWEPGAEVMTARDARPGRIAAKPTSARGTVGGRGRKGRGHCLLAPPASFLTTARRRLRRVLASRGRPGPVAAFLTAVMLLATALSANAAPTASNGEVTTTESTDRPFVATDFGFADTDPGVELASVKITSLPATGFGSLVLNDTVIPSASESSPQVVTKAQLDAGGLVFRPVSGQFGDGYATFMFKVNDGTEDSAAAYTMTVDVDAASGARGPGEQPGADGLDELLPGGERLGQDRHAGLHRRGPCRRLRPALGRDRPGPERLRHRLRDADAVGVLVERGRHGERARAHV